MGKVLHASDSGYFPFCIADGAPEDCPWTLEKAMQTYWRVRTWTFSASGIVRDNLDPGTFPFSSTITGITSELTLEEDLVCGENIFSFFGGLRYEAFIDFNGQVKTSGGLYDSGLNGFVLDYTTDPLEFAFNANFSSAFSISILGANIPISMVYSSSVGSFTVISGSATLTPTLWWSYGGTYDTSTGQRL
jgi:hypothetical protein